jgi:hypothetical protein
MTRKILFTRELKHIKTNFLFLKFLILIRPYFNISCTNQRNYVLYNTKPVLIQGG